MGNFNKGSKFGNKRSFNRGKDGKRQAMHTAICSQCGEECELPFKPTGNRPFFCNTCFEQQGGGDRPAKFGSRQRRERPRFDDKQMFDAVCNKCGEKCKIPFRPTEGKPIYCDNCFGKENKGERKSSDFSEEFKKLNEKLDKLIKILNLNEPSTKAAEKKVTAKKPVKEKADKKEKKAIKIKPTEKKVTKKKKKQ